MLLDGGTDCPPVDRESSDELPTVGRLDERLDVKRLAEQQRLDDERLVEQRLERIISVSEYSEDIYEYLRSSEVSMVIVLQ